jgi:hypothetical protein
MQEFYSSIQVSDEDSDIDEPDEEDDFEVIYQENVDNIQAGSHVTLDFIAYEEAVVLSDQIIYYYIYTNNEHIKSGSATTDNIGRFSISLDIPSDSGSISADFESPFEDQYGWSGDSDDGYEYRTDDEYISVTNNINNLLDPDSSIQIQTTTLVIGGITNVTISKPNSEDLYGFVMIFPGEFSIDQIMGQSQEPVWMPISASYRQFIMPEDGTVTHNFLLPEFLPDDETYTILVYMTDMNPQSMGFYWNVAHVKPGQQVSPEEDDDQNVLFDPVISPMGMDIPGFVFLLIFLVILIVVLIAIKRRRGKVQPTQPSQPQYQDQYPPQNSGYYEQGPPPQGPY